MKIRKKDRQTDDWTGTEIQTEKKDRQIERWADKR